MQVHFKAKAGPFEARQIKADDIHDVAQWCSGQIQSPAPDNVQLTIPIGSGQQIAANGSWVVRLGKQVRVFTAAEMSELFAPAEHHEPDKHAESAKPHEGSHAEGSGRPAQGHREEQSKSQQEQHVRNRDERAPERGQAQARNPAAHR